MSRNYRILKQASIGSQFAQVADVARKLVHVRPELARALQGLDWPAIRKEVALDAIQQVAQTYGQSLEASSGAAVLKDIDSGEPPRGDCVGALRIQNVTVALFVTDDRIVLAWAEQHFAADERRETAVRHAKAQALPAQVKRLKDQLDDAYQECALRASMRMASGGAEVQREVKPDGSIILRSMVKGSGS